MPLVIHSNSSRIYVLKLFHVFKKGYKYNNFFSSFYDDNQTTGYTNYIKLSLAYNQNADPVVKYLRANVPGVGKIDPGGSVNTGERVRMYSKVSDAETASSALTVSFRYRPQGGDWTTPASASYNPTWDYWYLDWNIPGDAALDLYDVRVEASDGEGGSVSYEEYGEFQIVA